MPRVHPIHVITLVLAGVAVIFSLLAMSAASEARDEAATAAALAGMDSSSGVDELQEALIRAGVIDDPSAIPDDHQQLGGPWGRCLTEAERPDLDLDAADTDAADVDVGADEPEVADCGTARVEVIACPDVEADTPPTPEDEEIDEGCTYAYRIDGQRFVVSDRVRPDDVESDAITISNVEGAAEVDRVATLEEDDALFIHLLDLDGGQDGLAAGWWYVFADG